MFSNRQTGLDLIRTLAVLFVPAVHFFLNTNFYSTPLIGKSMYLQTFLRMSFLICVPLFMILTGYLQINKTPSTKYFKKILPIILIYLIYSIIAIFVREVYFKEHFAPIDWLSMILKFQADSYSWYVNMYIGLFLISPYLNILYKNIPTKREKIWLIVIFLLITGVPSFLNLKARGYLFFPDFWVGIYPLTYYFIGCYIREYQVKVKKAWGFLALLLVNLFEAFIEIHYAVGGPFRGMAGYYSSIIVVIHSSIFFLLFYDIHIKVNFIAKILTLISTLSLDIYLASNVTDKFVYKYLYDHLFKSQQQLFHFYAPIVLTTFLLATTISFIRHKLIRIR